MLHVSIVAMDIVDISKSEATDIFIGNDNEQDVLHTQLAVLNRAYEMLRRADKQTSDKFCRRQSKQEPFTMIHRTHS